MKKVLVTGGAGFIGSHVVDLLIENNYNVAVVDDLSSGKRENVNSMASFHEMDVCSNELGKIFKSENPDYVIHQAAQIDVRKSITDPLSDLRVNVLGSINVLNYCKEYNIERIVYASTGGAIYGEPVHLPADEAHPPNPMSPYGASKLTVENYLALYERLFGLDYISLRFSNVYGPRQDSMGEAGVVAIFTGKLLSNQQPVINGDGRQTRDFVYVGDVAEANLISLEKKTSSKVFNIGSGIESSVNVIFEKLKKITGSKVNAIYGEAIKGEVNRISLNCSLANKELDWSAVTELDEGLKKTVDWFRKHKSD